MSSVDHPEAAARLASLDIATLDAAGVDTALRLARQLEGWLAAVKIAGSRRLDELRRVGEAGRAEVVTGRLWGRAGARDVQRRSDALTDAPAVEDALADGDITPAHVDAFAGAVVRTPAVADHQRELADIATTTNPDDFADLCTRMALLLADDNGVGELDRQRRDSRLTRWVDRITGMYHLRAEFDPERGAQLWAALDREIERHYHHGTEPDLTNHQRAATALHTISTRPDTASTDANGGTPGVAATVHVHVDLATLTHGLRPDSTLAVTGGGALPVATIRRMACDADIIPYVLNGYGVVVDVGRAKRLATRQQRHALRAMYPTCAIPDCRVAFDHTNIHHLVPFEQGGPTTLANLLPLCSRHHHDAHEGGWQLTLDPTTRDLTITRPDGATTHTALRRQPAA